MEEELRKVGGSTDDMLMLCIYCRQPYVESDEGKLHQLDVLMRMGNSYAYNVLAGYYQCGMMGLTKDMTKAKELYCKAGELGCPEAYGNLGKIYEYNEEGATREDMMKAKQYYEKGAIMGSIHARANIGTIEERAGNIQRAYKHYMIAARAGDTICLDQVTEGYKDGLVTKDDYAEVLRAYQKSRDETRSRVRDAAEIVYKPYSSLQHF